MDYLVSLDEMLLSGNTVALAVETAIAPLRIGATVAACDHLARELDAGGQTMAAVCVQCPDEGLMCVDCSNRHYDTHQPDHCFGCGVAGDLRPLRSSGRSGRWAGPRCLSGSGHLGCVPAASEISEPPMSDNHAFRMWRRFLRAVT